MKLIDKLKNSWNFIKDVFLGYCGTSISLQTKMSFMNEQF